MTADKNVLSVWLNNALKMCNRLNCFNNILYIIVLSGRKTNKNTNDNGTFNYLIGYIPPNKIPYMTRRKWVKDSRSF